MPPEYLAVIDFEATCADANADPNWDLDQQEIIELPVGLISVGRRVIVDSFDTFVEPVRQPKLTAFCTELTSIRQEDVAGQPRIKEAVQRLSTWLDGLGTSAGNTLAITCGDWDLKQMWPRQVGLVPVLRTPELFRRWANLKVIFNRHTGRPARGMMGMLRELGIEHQGHHRGADDVANLCQIAIHLLVDGAVFAPTWDEDRRQREYEARQAKLSEAQEALAEKREAQRKLPVSVPAEVCQRFADQITTLERRCEQLQTMAQVFAPSC